MNVTDECGHPTFESLEFEILSYTHMHIKSLHMLKRSFVVIRVHQTFCACTFLRLIWHDFSSPPSLMLFRDCVDRRPFPNRAVDPFIAL